MRWGDKIATQLQEQRSRSSLAENAEFRAHPVPLKSIVAFFFFFKLPATCQAWLGQELGCLHVIPLTLHLKNSLFLHQPLNEAHAPGRQGGGPRSWPSCPSPKPWRNWDSLSQKSKQYGIAEAPRRGRDLPHDTAVFLPSLPCSSKWKHEP